MIYPKDKRKKHFKKSVESNLKNAGNNSPQWNIHSNLCGCSTFSIFKLVFQQSNINYVSTHQTLSARVRTSHSDWKIFQLCFTELRPQKKIVSPKGI